MHNDLKENLMHLVKGGAVQGSVFVVCVCVCRSLFEQFNFQCHMMIMMMI